MVVPWNRWPSISRRRACSTRPSKMETELRPLKNTRDFFKKIIISKSSMKPWIDDDGILHLGLYEFLLNEAALDL